MKVTLSKRAFMALAISVTILTGCNGSSGTIEGMLSPPLLGMNHTPPKVERNYKTDALIFQGAATAFGDAEALAEIVDSHGLTYEIADEADMDSMSVDDLATYGVIIWPGGYAGQMSRALRPATRENIRRAVTERGVGFAGFCAGAFIAVSPPAGVGEEGPAYGFSIIPAEILPYYHLENEGTPAAMTPVRFADGSSRDLVWWGGPYLPEFPGGVIARYTDTNEPAIAQSWAGAGLLVISGPHPEAPSDWRAKLGLSDSDGMDQEIAWQMIDAALHQKPMKAF